MNEAIAANIREHRERLSWTQEHLAGAAGLTVRTIQRAEEGRGTSAETLSAIAGALNVSLEELRLDANQFFATMLGVAREGVTPELVAEKFKEIADKYMTVPLTIAACASDFAPLFATDCLLFDCVLNDSAVRDCAAELEQELRDLMDVGDELTPVQRRDAERVLDSHRDALDRLGAAISIGIHRHALKHEGQAPFRWRTVYVIVSSKLHPKTFVAIEKGAEVRFSG